jgi:GNAT superfamily N-acetyltransferase
MSDFVLKAASIAQVPAEVRVLLARGVAELVEVGFSEPGGWLLLSYGQSVFWLEERGKPIAVATYDEAREWSAAILSLVYVLPDFRRRGCFRQLLEAARHQARLDKLSTVQLGTHHTNEAMQQACRAMCMVRTFVRYSIPAAGGGL